MVSSPVYVFLKNEYCRVVGVEYCSSLGFHYKVNDNQLNEYNVPTEARLYSQDFVFSQRRRGLVRQRREADGLTSLLSGDQPSLLIE